MRIPLHEIHDALEVLGGHASLGTTHKTVELILTVGGYSPSVHYTAMGKTLTLLPELLREPLLRLRLTYFESGRTAEQSLEEPAFSELDTAGLERDCSADMPASARLIRLLSSS